MANRVAKKVVYGYSAFTESNLFFLGEELPMSKLAIMREFWEFLKVRKKWWLAPIIIFLMLLGALIVFTEGSAVAPFIYTLF